MTRRMRQRHEHLPRPARPLPDIVRDDGDPADEAMFITQTLEDPLRGVTLLLDPGLILCEDLVSDPDKRIQLRTRRRTLPSIPRRH